MKPVVEGLEDQVNWKISYVNIDDQCVVYKSHTKTTTCTCQCDQDHQDQNGAEVQLKTQDESRTKL